MKEKEDGKGKVKSRNKDKESRGEGRLFKLKWNFLEGALLTNTIPGIFIYKSAIFFFLVSPICVDCGLVEYNV